MTPRGFARGQPHVVLKYSQSQIRSELTFELLNRIGPLEGLGGLIVLSNEVENGPLKLIKAGKMIRLQSLRWSKLKQISI
jgi:hypothetical protein